VITDPADLQWTFVPASGSNSEAYWTATMEVSEQTFTMNNGETLITRAYGQAGMAASIPGPTMHLTPGEKYVLRFHNTLPYQAPSPEHNVFKDPNITNIHTHGVHISGESPGDDVTRFFEGGFGGDFVYDMPADHMGGTYWYHAHHHGSAYLQVAGGLLGLLLIDDANDGMPANVASMTERQLAINYLDVGAAGTGGDDILGGTLNSTWMVNGLIDGNLCMPVNEWQHFRILMAHPDSKSRTLKVNGDCDVEMMARDGVWRTMVPKNLPSNDIQITSASRVDLAVRCRADAELKIGNTIVANIYADGAGDPAPHPFAADGVSMWPSTRPDYLRDLWSETNVTFEDISMGARSINGSKFDAYNATFTQAADSVMEWSISGANQHPFHLHVYHMQAMGCGKDFEDGEYYDTVDSNCAVRFDLNHSTSSTYLGKTIFHCHVLAHEDQGAMGWLNVTGNAQGPPTLPSDANAIPPLDEYYSISVSNDPPADPSGLTATAVSSWSIDLAWSDNSNDEDGFDIERSLDGTNFSFFDTVGAGVTSYTDTTAAPLTTYWYRVLAFNGAGSSGYSNVASDTTPDAPAQGTSVQPQSITVLTVSVGGGDKAGQAVIVVEDDLGNLVADAVVGGEWSGDITESTAASDPTDTNGVTVVQTVGTARKGVSVTFCITDITHPTLDPFSASPGAVCGSN
jgi:FtsP/CotA-like multicopper oxidase with cupredoxin domain